MSRDFRTQIQLEQLKPIGSRLKDLIEKQKLKRTLIAKKLGVSRSTLSRYIAKGIDSIDTLVRVSNCLGVSYVDLLCDADQRQNYLPSACPCQHAGQVLRQQRALSRVTRMSRDARTNRSIRQTQEHLAEQMGVERRIVQYYEAQGMPRITSVIAAAQYYKIPIADFYCVRINENLKK